MKTAEQIAREALKREELAFGVKRLTEENDALVLLQRVERMLVNAIEADRVQRSADLTSTADASSKWATELTEYIIPGAEADDEMEAVEAHTAERGTIEAALGRYLDAKESE